MHAKFDKNVTDLNAYNVFFLEATIRYGINVYLPNFSIILLLYYFIEFISLNFYFKISIIFYTMVHLQ